MGVYTNYTGGYGTSFVGNYTQVEPFVGESFNYHQLGIIAASEINANHNAFMKSIALSELAAIEQTGDTDVLYESVNIKGIFEKIKMFFKKVIEKIHKIFRTFMAKLQSWFGDTKDFAIKYEKEVIKNWSQVSNNWDFKGYNYKKAILTKPGSETIKASCKGGNEALRKFVTDGDLSGTLDRMGGFTSKTVEFTVKDSEGAASVDKLDENDPKIKTSLANNTTNIPDDMIVGMPSPRPNYADGSKIKLKITTGKNVTAGADGTTLKDSDISAIREKMEDIKDDMRKSVIDALSNISTFESIIPVNFDNPSGIDAKEYSEELFKVFRNGEDTKDNLEKKDIQDCYGGSISAMMNFLKDYKKITGNVSTAEKKLTKGYDSLIKNMDKEENKLIKANKTEKNADTVKTNELIVQLSSMYQSIYSGLSECITEAFAAWMTAVKDACTQAKEIAVKVINLSKKMTESYDYGYDDDRSYDGGYDFISSVKLV